MVLGMAVARPPVVSQSEWDAAPVAMTERERTVAAEMLVSRATGSSERSARR